MQRTGLRTMRRQLDRRFVKLRDSDVFPTLHRPTDGWIRTIRNALGMSSADLGRRIGVRGNRVRQMEKDEPDGAVTLKTLKAAAEALGCELVYTLVPRIPLDSQVRNHAVKLARADVDAAARHMHLEGQGLDEESEQSLVEDRISEYVNAMPRDFWRRV